MDDTTKRDSVPPNFDAPSMRWARGPNQIAAEPELPGADLHHDADDRSEVTQLRAPSTFERESTQTRAPTAAEMTFASKMPPDHPGLRLDRPQARTLRRGPILAVGTVLVLAVLIAAAVAFSPKTDQGHAVTPTLPEGSTKNITMSEAVQKALGNDADLHPPPRLGPPLHGADSTTPVRERPAGASSSSSFSRQSLRETVREERAKAFASPILAELESPQQDAVLPVAGSTAASLLATAAAPPSAQPPAPGASTVDPNLQQHKSDFLKNDGVNNTTYLSQPVLMPRSPYEVKAGTIIPATLLTGINSDLPGQIVGQVRENVYDTVSGNYLLIPQGSKLLATYDSAVSYGQERVLFCWNRLVRPDGVSISLECMPGADLAGSSGIADDVNHHWWRIVTGVALGTLLSATADRAAGNVSGYSPTVPQLWAANAGGAVNQAATQITQKNLAIQPTITVRAGYSVNVIVTKDIVFPPYTLQGASR
jgi:type IV secretory pathway VirB10-like protein